MTRYISICVMIKNINLLSLVSLFIMLYGEDFEFLSNILVLMPIFVIL